MSHLIEYMVNVTLNRFNENQIIEKEDEDIYRYGLQILIGSIVKGIIILSIAFITGFLLEAIVFISVFGVLRIQAGGIHADSYKTCLITTLLFVFASIIIGKAINSKDSIFIFSSLLYISGLIVYMYAPVETPNKPLSDKEVIIYRRRSRITYIILMIGIIIIYFTHREYYHYCNVAVLSVFIEAMTLTPLASKFHISIKRIINKEVR